MKEHDFATLKLSSGIGLHFGFGCGFLYGIGGFVYDFLTTGINHGSYLALNALWGMHLLFSGLGFGIGAVIVLYRKIKGEA